MQPSRLVQGLEVLGQVLADEGVSADLVLVGGGALYLLGVLARPTADLDAVGRFEGGVLRAAQPFSPALEDAVRRVGAALDLSHVPRDEKDWLNAGPSMLVRFGLPDGFEARLTTRVYGALTIRIAARVDLIALKLLAATDPARGDRRRVDVADLRALAPGRDELLHALRWCARIDGRSDFVALDAAPVLRELGWAPEDLDA